MFGWLKAKPIDDPQLGTLQWKHGYWRGSIAFPGLDAVELRIHGDSGAPDGASLALARQVATRFEDWRPQVEAALFEHYEAYRDGIPRDQQVEEGLPDLAAASAVWAHVEPVYVLAGPLRGAPAPGPIVELAYRTGWDIEHTVAARLQDGRLVELCGSV
jgi:hypothetical protein